MGSSSSRFQAAAHRLELALFRANQRLINESVGGYTDEFRAYDRSYRKTVRRVLGPVDFAELLLATRQAQVVLVGDYHTLPQAQRAFYRVLRRQPAKDENVIIALEMLPASQQATIDRFVAGRLTASTLQRRTQWDQRWPFGPPSGFSAIFELARQRGWRVLGLDPDPPGQTLGVRDDFAAEQIAAQLEAKPDARIFVLMGELHLAPPHLPKAIEQRLPGPRAPGRVLRIHQNPERIWFDQASQGVPDEHDVLTLQDGAFALLTASPVVCQQSFLTWLDQIRDGELDEGGVALEETGLNVFRHAVLKLGRALNLPARAALKQVEVVGPADLSFFDRLVQGGHFNKRALSSIRRHILASESYYIPRARLVYLATLSLNHAAEEGSHFLRHHCSHEGLDDPKGMVDAFYSRILNEAIGFMGSKIVNPKRKCVDLADLRALVGAEAQPPHPPHPPRLRPTPSATSASGHPPGQVGGLDADVAAYVLAHKDMERGHRVPWLNQVFHGSPELFNAVTHVLGYLLGERLYYGLVRGVFTAQEARELYFEPFEEEGAALLLYFELAARVGMLSVPRRT